MRFIKTKNGWELYLEDASKKPDLTIKLGEDLQEENHSYIAGWLKVMADLMVRVPR